MSNMVNIEGLSKADVLAALFNASAPAGMGFLQAARGPQVMNSAYAQELLDLGSDASGDYSEGTAALRSSPVNFDYLYGRPLKLDLSSDTEFDPRGFDRNNGGDGSAHRVIDELRKSGEINSSPIQDLHETNMKDKVANTAAMIAMMIGSKVEISGPLSLALVCAVKRSEMTPEDLPVPPDFMSGREHLNWSTDQALKHFDVDPKKSVAVFITLVKQHPDTAKIATYPLTAMILADGSSSKSHMDNMMKSFAV
jgi:hypothetical protein